MQDSVGITPGRWDQPSALLMEHPMMGVGMLLTPLPCPALPPLPAAQAEGEETSASLKTCYFPPETTLVPDVNMH